MAEASRCLRVRIKRFDADMQDRNSLEPGKIPRLRLEGVSNIRVVDLQALLSKQHDLDRDLPSLRSAQHRDFSQRVLQVKHRVHSKAAAHCGMQVLVGKLITGS